MSFRGGQARRLFHEVLGYYPGLGIVSHYNFKLDATGLQSWEDEIHTFNMLLETKL